MGWGTGSPQEVPERLTLRPRQCSHMDYRTLVLSTKEYYLLITWVFPALHMIAVGSSSCEELPESCYSPNPGKACFNNNTCCILEIPALNMLRTQTQLRYAYHTHKAPQNCPLHRKGAHVARSFMTLMHEFPLGYDRYANVRDPQILNPVHTYVDEP